MPISHCAENPTAIYEVAVAFGIQHAVDKCIHRVNDRIFGVKMENSITEFADGKNWINTLPEETPSFIFCHPSDNL